jgi:hypothetical protein
MCAVDCVSCDVNRRAISADTSGGRPTERGDECARVGLHRTSRDRRVPLERIVCIMYRNSCNSFRLVLSFHRTRPAGPPSGGGAAEHACASTRPGADDHSAHHAGPAGSTHPAPSEGLVPRPCVRRLLRAPPSPVRRRAGTAVHNTPLCTEHAVFTITSTLQSLTAGHRYPIMSYGYVVEARGLLMHRVRVAVS